MVDDGSDAVTFRLAIIGRGGGDSYTVRVHGAQAVACRRFVRPGHRVAIEGRVLPGACGAQVAAERVQFLTTRAQASEMEAGGRRAA